MPVNRPLLELNDIKPAEVTKDGKPIKQNSLSRKTTVEKAIKIGQNLANFVAFELYDRSLRFATSSNTIGAVAASAAKRRIFVNDFACKSKVVPANPSSLFNLFHANFQSDMPVTLDVMNHVNQQLPKLDCLRSKADVPVADIIQPVMPLVGPDGKVLQSPALVKFEGSDLSHGIYSCYKAPEDLDTVPDIVDFVKGTLEMFKVNHIEGVTVRVIEVLALMCFRGYGTPGVVAVKREILDFIVAITGIKAFPIETETVMLMENIMDSNLGTTALVVEDIAACSDKTETWMEYIQRAQEIATESGNLVIIDRPPITITDSDIPVLPTMASVPAAAFSKIPYLADMMYKFLSTAEFPPMDPEGTTTVQSIVEKIEMHTKLIEQPLKMAAAWSQYVDQIRVTVFDTNKQVGNIIQKKAGAQKKKQQKKAAASASETEAEANEPSKPQQKQAQKTGSMDAFLKKKTPTTVERVDDPKEAESESEVEVEAVESVIAKLSEEKKKSDEKLKKSVEKKTGESVKAALKKAADECIKEGGDVQLVEAHVKHIVDRTKESTGGTVSVNDIIVGDVEKKEKAPPQKKKRKEPEPAAKAKPLPPPVKKKPAVETKKKRKKQESSSSSSEEENSDDDEEDASNSSSSSEDEKSKKKKKSKTKTAVVVPDQAQLFAQFQQFMAMSQKMQQQAPEPKKAKKPKAAKKPKKKKNKDESSSDDENE